VATSSAGFTGKGASKRGVLIFSRIGGEALAPLVGLLLFSRTGGEAFAPLVGLLLFTRIGGDAACAAVGALGIRFSGRSSERVSVEIEFLIAFFTPGGVLASLDPFEMVGT